MKPGDGSKDQHHYSSAKLKLLPVSRYRTHQCTKDVSLNNVNILLKKDRFITENTENFSKSAIL
jgi:hypothetical protein